MNAKGRFVDFFEMQRLPARGLRIGRLIAISVLPLLFSACVHWPDIATDCESYGVLESGNAMGEVNLVEPLYRDQLDETCSGVSFPTAAEGTKVSGCTIPKNDGSVDVYYWVGDRCALNHELCHAKHGYGHTDRYEQELKEGIAMPYCPQNQLSLKLSSN
jgi:hypothetical protein